MAEMVRIRSVKDYFNEFAVEGIGKGANKQMIKQQLIDAFHKEIFGLVAMRTKKAFYDIPPEGDPEAIRIARSVVKETTKKWISLCNLFEKYRETAGLIGYADISLEDEEEVKPGEVEGEKEDASEGGSDTDGDDISPISVAHMGTIDDYTAQIAETDGYSADIQGGEAL